MRNTIISSIRQGIRNAIESVVSALAPIFYWPGTHTLEATTGTDPTFTRATAATFEDFEGLIKTVESSEPRFQGARRVENLAVNSEDLTNGTWYKNTNTTITDGQTDPDGGTTALRITADGGTALYGDLNLIPAGISVQQSWWIKRVTGTGQIQFYTGLNGGATEIISGVTTSWQRFAQTPTAASSAGNIFGIYLGVNGDEVDVWHPMIENVTGQTNQNPSEYVSTGVLSAPYHGANVDGVQYFNTLNANTVTANVVTEAVGSPLTRANTQFGDLHGVASPASYFSTPNVVTTFDVEK